MENLIIIMILLPFIAAPIAYFIGAKDNKIRNFVSILTTIGVFAISLVLFIDVLNGNTPTLEYSTAFGMGLSFMIDGFRAIHIVLASFMWIVVSVFNLEYSKKLNDKKQNRFLMFILLTLGATLGVFMSADLFTTFVFFEIMSFTSYAWVFHDESKASLKASETYLCVSVICGMVMLMGLFMLYTTTGTLVIADLFDACANAGNTTFVYVAGLLTLVGFGAKAGMYPLHIWMPESYAAAPAPATALLSGILSKTGVYGIILITSTVFYHDAKWGMWVFVLGLMTMFWGGFMALFSMNLKKIIACSSMSQIGFILVGIGMQGLLGEDNALAVRGTLLHMVNHSLIKLVLFVLVGVVFANVKKYNLNNIRGFGRNKPVFLITFSVAALGVGGMPFFNGYVSKTLIHESIVEYIAHLAEHGQSTGLFTFFEWIFLISGGLTVAYMLKIFFALFIEKGEKEFSNKNYMTLKTKVLLIFTCVVMVLIGVIPNITADSIATFGQSIMYGENPEHAIEYFSFINIKGACISIALGILFYRVIVRQVMMRKNKDGINEYLDLWPRHFSLEEAIYRPVIQKMIPAILGVVCKFFDQYLIEWLFKLAEVTLALISKISSELTDSLIYIVTKTLYKTVPVKEVPAKTPTLAYKLGSMLDSIFAFYCRAFNKDQDKSYADKMNEIDAESDIRRRMISASLSYGLLFCAAGLVVVLIYLLIG